MESSIKELMEKARNGDYESMKIFIEMSPFSTIPEEIKRMSTEELESEIQALDYELQVNQGGAK